MNNHTNYSVCALGLGMGRVSGMKIMASFSDMN